MSHRGEQRNKVQPVIETARVRPPKLSLLEFFLLFSRIGLSSFGGGVSVSIHRSVVEHGGWLGEGGGLARAGVPTIGYIPQPNYLLAGPADGCIEKLSPQRLHAEIEVFAKVIHKMDAMPTADLRA